MASCSKVDWVSPPGERVRKEVKVSMRAMDCPDDGHHMEADNDEELFKLARQHTNEAHPEAQLTDEQVRQIVAENAYDK
jgi:predicted small metal-binding protein